MENICNGIHYNYHLIRLRRKLSAIYSTWHTYKHIQCLYVYHFHFYDMVRYGIPMLWFAMSLLCYEIFVKKRSDMVFYGMELHAMQSYKI